MEHFQDPGPNYRTSAPKLQRPLAGTDRRHQIQKSLSHPAQSVASLGRLHYKSLLSSLNGG
jgi:hypothetical protein